jgi:uncharacterized membrane protein YkvA (DUF1232 family)
MRKRLMLLWTLLRGDARRVVRAWRHPEAPAWFRPAVLGLLLYLVSPLDLLPDALPLVGMVDDLVLLPLAVHWMLSLLPPGVRADLESPHATGRRGTSSGRSAR